MATYLKTAPTIEPISVSEAKAHLRVDIDDDDALISTLITAARQHIEITCRPRLALITQTWQLFSDVWPSGDTIELRPYPLQSVTSIGYTDDDGASATISSLDYLVDVYSKPGRLRLKTSESWPAVTLRELNGLQVEFLAGFGSASTAVPETLKQAIKLLVGHWYENREAMLIGQVSKQLEFTLNALLTPYRMEVG